MSRRFNDNPDNAPAKQEEYKALLSAMDDDGLFSETRRKIWLSAFAANNGASCYHWQCDATYAEWRNRGKEERYGHAHKAEMAAAGY